MTTEDYNTELEQIIDLTNYLHFHDQAGSIAFAVPVKSAKAQPEPTQIIINMGELQAASKEVIKEAPGVKKRLCEALASAATDLKSITTVVFGILFPLSLSGQINVSITPLIIASISLTIFNSGVKYFCADQG